MAGWLTTDSQHHFYCHDLFQKEKKNIQEKTTPGVPQIYRTTPSSRREPLLVGKWTTEDKIKCIKYRKKAIKDF